MPILALLLTNYEKNSIGVFFRVLHLLPVLMTEGLSTHGTLQGLFVGCIYVGSGDPVRVLRLFHNKYAGYN